MAEKKFFLRLMARSRLHRFSFPINPAVRVHARLSGIFLLHAHTIPLTSRAPAVSLKTMQTILTTFSAGLTGFFAFKAYVILPVFMLVLALIARMKPLDALFAALKTGAGFAGIFIVFNFFVTQISPAIAGIIAVRHLDFPVVDVGWPPLAAITWSSGLTPLVILLVLALNAVLLATRLTKTLYIDLWNYWHFALIGALVQAATGNVALSLSASVLIALYTIKVTELSAPYVRREQGLEGIAISPISVSGFLPYAVLMDRLFDAIPGVRKFGWNPSRSADEKNENGANGAFRLLGEPMVIGVLVGLFLSLLAGYGIRQTLETAVNIAAVMFLLPRCGGLIGEGMGEIALEFKNLVERKFPSLKGLSIAMDTGILMTNRSVIATGLILIPVSLLVAFILPGYRVLPLGDLPNLISIMSLIVLVLRGNVIRSVLAGIPIVATFLLVSSRMAPVFTALAAKTGMSAGGAGEITAFTDGGNQIRYWFYWLFQGNVLAFAVIPVVLAMLAFAWRTHRKMVQATMKP